MERFPYRHGTSDDVWWRMVGIVPTLIVSPTDMERLTTYGGVWRRILRRMVVCYFPPIK